MDFRSFFLSLPFLSFQFENGIMPFLASNNITWMDPETRTGNVGWKRLMQGSCINISFLEYAFNIQNTHKLFFIRVNNLERKCMCFTDYKRDKKTSKHTKLTIWRYIRKSKKNTNYNEKFLGKTDKTNKWKPEVQFIFQFHYVVCVILLFVYLYSFPTWASSVWLCGPLVPIYHLVAIVKNYLFVHFKFKWLV